jgi:hypothetical protein
MRKNLLKPLFVAAFGMMACLGANAQNSVSNAEPDMTAGNTFWGSYYKFSVVQKVSGDATAVTYDVNIIGLSGSEAGEYQGDNLAEITIPNTVIVGNGGVQYTLNVKSVAELQNYSALETLSFDEDYAGTAEAGAFKGLSGLKEVIANAPTAVALDAEAFDLDITNSASVKLIVPAADASVQSYAKTKGWRRFLNINNGTYTLGDVSGDGVIKAADVTLLQAVFKGKRAKTDPEARYDVNGSGGLNAPDVTILQSKFKKKYK